MVEASIKWDGTLGLAFIWNKELVVCTRSRMDSEQALWAKWWIQNECDISVFKEGWTYMFEIIYSDNTVVIDYPFEGLVLLAVTNADGEELPYHDMYDIAKRAGFTLASQMLCGSYSEIESYCGIGNANREGWVIRDAGGNRVKLVNNEYKVRSRQASLIHPQLVWLLLRQNQLEEFTSGLTERHKEEVKLIQFGITNQFLCLVFIIFNGCLESRGRLLGFLVNIFDGVTGDNNEGSDDQASDEDADASNLQNRSVEAKSLKEQTLVICNVDKAELKFKDSSENERKKSYCLHIWQDIYSEINRTLDANTATLAFEKLMSFDKEFKTLTSLVITHLNEDQIIKARDHLVSGHLSKLQQNLTPIFHGAKDNTLRVPMLDFLKPRDHVLEGYQPSDNFKQTWCKGWRKGWQPLVIDQDNMQSVLREAFGIKQPCLLFDLPSEVLKKVLMLLDAKDLEAVRLSCKHLCCFVDSFEELRNAITDYNILYDSDCYDSDYDCDSDYDYRYDGSFIV